MNYKRCKMVCGIMICSLMITSVTACGTAANDNSTATRTEITSTSEGNTFTYTDSEEDAPVSTTVMAKVDSVSGNEVTLSVGSGAPEQPDGNASDENAILVSNGATVNLKNSTIDRTSSDSTGGDNSSFYGVGAAVLTTDGTTYLSNANITTDAAGGAGVFAYGDGTVYVADSDITTKQDTSGGIHAAGGGTLYAWKA